MGRLIWVCLLGQGLGGTASASDRRLVTRRAVQATVLLSWITLLAGMAGAQDPKGFDPVATARLRAGEVAREIAASGRDPSVPEPAPAEVFNAGLLLQAGLRALLPVSERQGVALPGGPSPTDPASPVEAQENYKAVFASGAEATPAQKATAIMAIKTAAQRLSSEGYTAFSQAISEWLKTQ
jgi:hypothetical protein